MLFGFGLFCWFWFWLRSLLGEVTEVEGGFLGGDLSGGVGGTEELEIVYHAGGFWVIWYAGEVLGVGIIWHAGGFWGSLSFVRLVLVERSVGINHPIPSIIKNITKNQSLKNKTYKINGIMFDPYEQQSAHLNWVWMFGI